MGKTIDLAARQKELVAKEQEQIAENYEKDVSASIDWQPTFSRIKIKPDHETLSGSILTITKDTFVRGTVLAAGPKAGWKDGVLVEKFFPGQKVIYQKAHEICYKGADGVCHYFLRTDADLQSIVAIEPRELTGDRK
jgi:hypothetical protein